MRTTNVLVIISATTAALAFTAAPAAADPIDDSTTTFSVLEGTLDIGTAEAADLGDGDPGTTIVGQLGNVSVSDTRAGADASWLATVTSTTFTTGTGTASQTIDASAVDYWSGSAVSTTGDGTFTPGQDDSAAADPLDDETPVNAFTHTGGTGNNSATRNPTLEVNVPLANEAGTYTGTVTHSVA